MKNYIAPLSPREKAEIETNNAALIPAPTIQNPEPLSQADGFAEEVTNVK